MPDEDSDVDEEGSPKPDGLSNQDEAIVGTDPLNPDSDGDELLDGAEAVPLSDKMKVPAARELRYAVIRLGVMKNTHGVNSRGEVLLVDDGESETTQGYLWKNGVSQIIGTGLRGTFRGPMEDGTVYFATPTEESSFTDSFGLAVSLKSRLKAWKNGTTIEAGLFYENNIWENGALPSFPTNHPTTEFLNANIAAAYSSAWSAMRATAAPPFVPPNFSFSPEGNTYTTSSGQLSRINDLGDRTYSFIANFSSTFSGPTGGQFTLPAQIEITGWMSFIQGFSSGQGYWKLNSPPEPNETTNLPRDMSPRGTSEAKRTTDSNGFFKIEGIQGKNLGVISLVKNGYVPFNNSNPHSFEYAGFWEPSYHVPDRSNPVVFRLMKKGEAANLTRFGPTLFGAKPDGSPLMYDFATGRKSSGSADVSVRVRRGARDTNRQFDWEVTIEAVGSGAGLLHSEEEFMNEAPEYGYQQKWAFARKAGQVGFQSEMEAKFFFKCAEGQFARIEVRILPEYNDLAAVDLTSYFNSTPGSRNLEFDPAKVIKSP